MRADTRSADPMGNYSWRMGSGETTHWDDDRPLPRPAWHKWAWLALAVAIIAPILAYTLMRTVIHGSVNDSTLATSVAVAYGSAFTGGDFDDCRKLRSGDWRCSVVDAGGSGEMVYDVHVRPGSSCWSATLHLDNGEDDPPKNLDSCVYVIQKRLIDSLSG